MFNVARFRKRCKSAAAEQRGSVEANPRVGETKRRRPFSGTAQAICSATLTLKPAASRWQVHASDTQVHHMVDAATPNFKAFFQVAEDQHLVAYQQHRAAKQHADPAEGQHLCRPRTLSVQSRQSNTGWRRSISLLTILLTLSAAAFSPRELPLGMRCELARATTTVPARRGLAGCLAWIDATPGLFGSGTPRHCATSGWLAARYALNTQSLI